MTRHARNGVGRELVQTAVSLEQNSSLRRCLDNTLFSFHIVQNNNQNVASGRLFTMQLISETQTSCSQANISTSNNIMSTATVFDTKG